MSALDPSYITLREFAEQRGMRTDRIAMQRLRRRLVQKQAKNPAAVFLLRLSESPNDAIKTTMPLMRQHCPEFFDRRSELEQLVKKEFATVNETLRQLKMTDSAIAARLRDFKKMLDEHLTVHHGASPPGQG